MTKFLLWLDSVLVRSGWPRTLGLLILLSFMVLLVIACYFLMSVWKIVPAWGPIVAVVAFFLYRGARDDAKERREKREQKSDE